MDERDLPSPIESLTIRGGATATAASILGGLGEPRGGARWEQPDSRGQTRPTTTDQGRELGYNGDNWSGGLCPAPRAEPAQPQDPRADHVSSLPAPLVPDQPLPPGAPPGLAAAMNPASPTASTELSTDAPTEPYAEARGERAGSAQAASAVASPAAGLVGNAASAADAAQAAQAGAPPHGQPDDGVTPADRKKYGTQHPYKPVSPDQVAEFAQMWYDPAYTIDQIARRYHAGSTTVSRWRAEFGLPDRAIAVDQAKKADNMVDVFKTGISSLKGIVAATQAQGGPVLTPTVVDSDRFDPLKDPEIVKALEQIRSEARIMSAHSDLQPLQRLLMRLSVVAATKLPVASWTGLTVIIESLQRTILNARRIEADIPLGQNDPVQLRKEAAGQLMREMRSVLSPDEQAALAKLVKAAADRLMAKGAIAETVVAEVEA